MPDYNLSSTGAVSTAAELARICANQEPSQDSYNAAWLHGTLSMSNQEIRSLGFDLPQCQEQEVEPSAPKTKRRKSSHER